MAKNAANLKQWRSGKDSGANAIFRLMVLSILITVVNSLVIIPVGSETAYDPRNLPILDEEPSVEVARGRRAGLYEDPLGPQPLPYQYVIVDGATERAVAKRYLRSGRRHQEYTEGKESRPGLPLRFGKRSLARFVLGRIILKAKARRGRSQDF